MISDQLPEGGSVRDDDNEGRDANTNSVDDDVWNTLSFVVEISAASVTLHQVTLSMIGVKTIFSTQTRECGRGEENSNHPE